MTGMPPAVDKSATASQILRDRSAGWKFNSIQWKGRGEDMEKAFDFERLVELCRLAHEETRDSAVRTVARLAFRRDKNELCPPDREGQVVESASDLIRNPVVLDLLGLEKEPAYSQSDLEIAIIDRLQRFLLELGKGFLFEARGKRFSFDDSPFFVDLVFYNRLLRCYVLIDLKIGQLTHHDLARMQTYVNDFDRHVKTDDELPTVGILLCDLRNEAVVELTLPEDTNICASKYQLYLPSRDELADQVARVRREIARKRGGADG